jgi:hypothetical protein
MPSYDAIRYDPPAPVASVVLRPTDRTDPSVNDVLLLIDTGADITLLQGRPLTSSASRRRPGSNTN